ncbi:MAG TPA: hypothetical protein PKG79_05890 [Propioniciclava tarda]|nr:hypothetical protein [Propioniciclava tarda]
MPARAPLVAMGGAVVAWVAGGAEVALGCGVVDAAGLAVGLALAGAGVALVVVGAAGEGVEVVELAAIDGVTVESMGLDCAGALGCSGVAIGAGPAWQPASTASDTSNPAQRPLAASRLMWPPSRACTAYVSPR